MTTRDGIQAELLNLDHIEWAGGSPYGMAGFTALRNIILVASFSV